MFNLNELKKKEEGIANEIKKISNVGDRYPVVDGIIDIERYIDKVTKYKILWIQWEKKIYLFLKNVRKC